MGRSLGMAAYRAYARRTAARAYVPSGAKPNGSLVWIHAGEPENLLAIADMAHRICAVRYGVQVLITLPDQISYEAARKDNTAHNTIHFDLVPSEHPEAIAKFWSHWAPDMAIWAYGDLRPGLLEHVHKNKCPIALIDADDSGFDSRRDRWLPELSRQLLDPFCALFARSSSALRRLEALGLNTTRISVTPPLQAGGQALTCEDTDLSDLSEALRGRPVWLASNVQQDEIEPVLKAHRQAIRLSHRLLLILHPADEVLAEVFKNAVATEGFSISDWTEGAYPDDPTQVLFTSDPRDLGLFFRVAPVTFMGSSLIQGHTGRNPFEAAALGSAVLYGPNVRHYMPFYSRLAKAGAARIVKDGETLGNAVAQLIAPDQAAAMAVAGWDVVSQGADLTDRVIDLVHTTLDGELKMTNARA